MNCESCAGIMLQVHGQSHFHCQACNRFQFPHCIEKAEDALQPSGKVTDFECSKCQQPLEVGQLRKLLDVCFCQTCRGFVIDSDSLGDVIHELRSSYEGPEDRPTPVNPADLDAKHPCPACLEPMEAHPYYGPGNVVIDTCMNCQLVWFDHGELARIVRAPGMRPKPKAEIEIENAIQQAMQKNTKIKPVGFVDILIQSLS